jgi:hypothetical protein
MTLRSDEINQSGRPNLPGTDDWETCENKEQQTTTETMKLTT